MLDSIISHINDYLSTYVLVIILVLGKYAYRALSDYNKQRKEGKDPVFKSKSISLPVKTDYWND